MEIIETGKTETFDASQLQASDESELILEEIINIGEDIYTTDEILATSKEVLIFQIIFQNVLQLLLW